MEDTKIAIFMKLLDKLLDGFKSYQLWLIVFIFRILVFLIPSSILASLHLQNIQESTFINILFFASIAVIMVYLFIHISNKVNRRIKLISFLKNIGLDDAKMIKGFIDVGNRTCQFSVSDGIAESLMKLRILEVNVSWITPDAKRAYSMSVESWKFFRKKKNIEFLEKILKKNDNS